MLQKILLATLLSIVGVSNIHTAENNQVHADHGKEQVEEVKVSELQRITEKYGSNSYLGTVVRNENLVAPSDDDPTGGPDYTDYTDKSLYSTTTFNRVNYFQNLTTYSPNNNIGSCGFVSLIQTMSFYDTFYNDDVIPNVYDVGNTSALNEAQAKAQSPGVLKQSYSGSGYPTYYQYAHGTQNTDLQSRLTVLHNVHTTHNDNDGTHYDEDGNLVPNFNYSIGAWDYENALDHLYANNSIVSVNLFHDMSQSSYIDLIEDTIDSGNPIIVHIQKRDALGNAFAHHSVVAYSYDEGGIYANFGWGASANSNLLLGGTAGYTEIYYAATLNYSSLGHRHSNNYIINGKSYCGCNISDEVSFTNSQNWTNIPPSLYWMKNLYDPNESFSIAFRNSSNGSDIVSFTTQHNQMTLSSNAWKSIINSCNGTIYLYFKRNSSKVNYVASVTSFAEPTNTMDYVILSPSSYGFADAYPTDDLTRNSYKTHVSSSGFPFKTRRYRTGFIQGEYVVMSCIKTNITEAFIEYAFNTPVYRIDVELTHWREYSNEWLDKNSGISELQTWHVKDWWNPFDSSRWIQKFDLLSDQTALPRDRTNPTTYTIEFATPVMGFRFYSKINAPAYSTSNRGRVCIGDMKIYLEG